MCRVWKSLRTKSLELLAVEPPVWPDSIMHLHKAVVDCRLSNDMDEVARLHG